MPDQIVQLDVEFSVPAGAPIGKYREFFQPVLFQTPGGTFADPYTFLDVNVI